MVDTVWHWWPRSLFQFWLNLNLGRRHSWIIKWNAIGLKTFPLNLLGIHCFGSHCDRLASWGWFYLYFGHEFFLGSWGCPIENPICYWTRSFNLRWWLGLVFFNLNGCFCDARITHRRPHEHWVGRGCLLSWEVASWLRGLIPILRGFSPFRQVSFGDEEFNILKVVTKSLLASFFIVAFEVGLHVGYEEWWILLGHDLIDSCAFFNGFESMLRVFDFLIQKFWAVGAILNQIIGLQVIYFWIFVSDVRPIDFKICLKLSFSLSFLLVFQDLLLLILMLIENFTFLFD